MRSRTSVSSNLFRIVIVRVFNEIYLSISIGVDLAEGFRPMSSNACIYENGRASNMGRSGETFLFLCPKGAF